MPFRPVESKFMGMGAENLHFPPVPQVSVSL